MEWAGVVVEGCAGTVEDPVAFEEVAGRRDSGWGAREEGGVEGEEQESEEN